MYQRATAPFSNSGAAILGAALAFSAMFRGVTAPARTPSENGLTGTSAVTITVAVPPFVSTVSSPLIGLAAARSSLPRT